MTIFVPGQKKDFTEWCINSVFYKAVERSAIRRLKRAPEESETTWKILPQVYSRSREDFVGFSWNGFLMRRENLTKCGCPITNLTWVCFIVTENFMDQASYRELQ